MSSLDQMTNGHFDMALPEKPKNEGPTSPKEWRKGREEGVLFHFPSGMIARVRPINVDTFIAYSGIPDGLTSIVSAIIEGKNPLSAGESLSPDLYKKVGQLYDIYCRTCFMEPKICAEGAEPADDEISVNDISDGDKQMLFAFLGQPAAVLAGFRPEPTNPVDNLVDSAGDTPAS